MTKLDGDSDDGDEPIPILVHISNGMGFVPTEMEADTGANPTTRRFSTYARTTLMPSP